MTDANVPTANVPLTEPQLDLLINILAGQALQVGAPDFAATAATAASTFSTLIGAKTLLNLPSETLEPA